VDRLAADLEGRYTKVAIGYADCGTYGALDEVCRELGIPRLEGLHCYDLYSGSERLERFFDEQPGTYVLTDFLVRSFGRTVVAELGLDRHPELRDDYFGNYTRVMWLAQRPTLGTKLAAERAAAALGLPLEVREVGDAGLERGLAELLSSSAPVAPPP